MSFITGSRAYGTPTPTSDIDLVVLVSQQEHDLLLDHSDRKQATPEDYRPNREDEHSFGTPMRFGKLNLLVCTEQGEYDRWKSGTDRLVAIKPVPRTIAVALFDAMRIKY